MSRDTTCPWTYFSAPERPPNPRWSFKRVSRSCMRARAFENYSCPRGRPVSYARRGAYPYIACYSHTRTDAPSNRDRLGRTAYYNCKLSHLARSLGTPSIASSRCPGPCASVPHSAAAAVTNIGNLRAQGTHQTLGPCANIMRPGCSSDSGHVRANMSMLLHASSYSVSITICWLSLSKTLYITIYTHNG